jgi:septum site-determining protein MinD
MSEVIVVTSGKGGVGKTTTSANFAAGLALRGKKVAVIDFDVGLRNLDLVMGCERRVVYDFVNVIHGEATLNQALIRDKNAQNLYILAASQTRDKEALSEEGVGRVIQDLKGMGFDYIVCDSPAGIETGAIMALTFADHAIVVVNPEVSSVRDSDRIIGIIQSRSKRAREGGEPVQERLLVTRYSPRRVKGGEMLSHHDILDILKIPLLGLIPESQRVLESSNSGTPAVHDAESEVAQAYFDAIDRFLGQEVPLRFADEEEKGFLRRIFSGITRKSS